MKVYLTFDIDWASDRTLQYVLNKLERYACRATMFATHDSPLIQEMQGHELIEMGIHPNFNNNLTVPEGSTPKSARDILRDLKEIVPDAICSRSHSLTQSTTISNLYRDFGIEVDSNVYMPFRQVETVAPWKFWTGTHIVPFVWSDYIDGLRGGDHRPEDLLRLDTIVKVIAFHPIHVHLNTADVADYQAYKQSSLDVEEFNRQRPDRYGIGNVLDALLEAIDSGEYHTGHMREFAAANKLQ